MFSGPAAMLQAEVGVVHRGGSGHEQEAVLRGGREQWLKHTEDSGRQPTRRSVTERFHN